MKDRYWYRDDGGDAVIFSNAIQSEPPVNLRVALASREKLAPLWHIGMRQW